ncbi:MAG: hypothetical protein ABSC05_29065 [Candidatus Solibacter sp.]|jgi:hypothetical protein
MTTMLVFLSLLRLLAAGFPLHAQDVARPPTPVPTADTQSDANPPAPSLPVPVAGDPLYAPLAATPRAQTLDEKFMSYAIVTFGPRVLFTPAIGAAIRMARPRNGYPRDWSLGAGAFGRNYGAALANRTAMETGRFLTGALLHEDFRYRPSKSKDPMARIFHALAFTFVDKSDSGHDRIAMANFVAAGAEGFAGNLYLPAGFNNLSHAEARAANAFGHFAMQNLLREFAPELLKATHKVHLPFPRVPVPGWWVKR